MLYALTAAAGIIAGFVAGWLRRAQVADICPDCGQYRGEACGACERIWQATAAAELAVSHR